MQNIDTSKISLNDVLINELHEKIKNNKEILYDLNLSCAKVIFEYLCEYPLLFNNFDLHIEIKNEKLSTKIVSYLQNQLRLIFKNLNKNKKLSIHEKIDISGQILKIGVKYLVDLNYLQFNTNEKSILLFETNKVINMGTYLMNTSVCEYKNSKKIKKIIKYIKSFLI